MKTILSATILITLSTSVIFGQTTRAIAIATAKTEFSFCNIISEDSEMTIKYADLGKCDELFPTDKNLKIKYFILSYSAGRLFGDIKNTGSKFSKEIKDFLKTCESQKVEFILIEANVLDGTKEKELSALKITLIRNTKSQEIKSNKGLLEEPVQSIVPPLLKEDDFHVTYEYDKEKFLSSITHAVLSGKLKAYFDYPDGELTIKEFNNILFNPDTTKFQDPSNPGVIIFAPISTLIHKYYQLKFNEKVELDTSSNTLRTKISTITFCTYKYTESGKIVGGMRKLFDVKLND